MKRIFTASVVFVIFAISIFAKENLLVMPVGYDNKNFAKYQKQIYAILEKSYLDTGKYAVVSRVEIDKALNEQKMVLSGIIDEKQGVETGKIAGAKKAVIANILNVSTDNYYGEYWTAVLKVEIKMMDIETTEVLENYEFQENGISEIDKNDAVNDAVGLIKRSLKNKLDGVEEEAPEKVVQKDEEKILLLPFELKDKAYSRYRKELAAAVEEGLAKSKKYKVMSKSDIGRMLAENRSSNTAGGSKLELGKLANAAKIVSGNIFNINIYKDGNEYKAEIDANIKIYDSDTLQVLHNIDIKQTEKADSGNDALRKIMEMSSEKVYLAVSELKKSRIFIRGEGGYNMGYSAKDFYSHEDYLVFDIEDREESLELNGAAGIEFVNTALYLYGGIEKRSTISVYKAGIGLEQRILKLGILEMAAGTKAGAAYASGTIGRTVESRIIGNESIESGSDVNMAAFGYGVEPYASVSAVLFDTIVLSVKGGYDYYLELNKVKLNIKDKYTGNIVKPDAAGFEPVFSINGLKLSTGIQIQF